MKKWLFLILVLFLLSVIIFFKLSGFHYDISKITAQDKLLIFVVVTIAGLIDSINICAISVLFISLSFFAGFGNFRKKILTFGFWYIFGIFLSYFLIGVGILKTLGSIGIPTNLILKIFAFVLILTGVNEFLKNTKPESAVKLGIPNFIKPRLAKLIQKNSICATFILGVLVGLFEFPCTGGPYLFVLGLLQARETFATGLVYLFYYNFLFVLPLIIILYSVYQLQDLEKVRQKNTTFQTYGKYFTPAILILLGILILLFYK